MKTKHQQNKRSALLKTKSNGFTLIELLITTSLLAMMGLAVYSTFASGIRVWQRSQAVNTHERDVRIVLDQMAKELRNCYRYTGIDFKGTDEQVTFPAYIVSNEEDDLPVRGVGTMTYFFDSSKDSVMAIEKKYSDLFKTFKEPRAKVVVDNVKNMVLKYYFYNETVKAFEWMDVWENRKDYPLGLKITLLTKVGEEEKEFLKTVYFPIDLNVREIIDETAESQETES